MSFSWKNVLKLFLISFFTLVSGYIGSYGYSAVKRFYYIRSEIKKVDENYQNIEIHPSVKVQSLKVESKKYLPNFKDVFIRDYNGTFDWIYYYELKIKENVDSNRFISDFFINRCLNIHDLVHAYNNEYHYRIYSDTGNLLKELSLNKCAEIVREYLPVYKKYLGAANIFLDENQNLKIVYHLDVYSDVENFYESSYLGFVDGISSINESVRNEFLSVMCEWPSSFDYSLIYVSHSFDVLLMIEINDYQCATPKGNYRENKLYSFNEISLMGVDMPSWYLEEPSVNFWQRYLDSLLK